MFLFGCDDLLPIIKFIKLIFLLIQWVIPVGLIVMGAWDLGKAVFSSDDKEIKAAVGKLIKRAIAAAAIFFLVIVVKLIMGMVGDSDAENPQNILDCWDQA